jgi:uncharacterized protein involved in type VI secretion and phage assembly
MGCGSSKSAEVVVGNAPAEKPNQSPSSQTVAVQQVKDSSNGGNEIITEDTPGGEQIASQDAKDGVELSLEGRSMSRQGGARPQPNSAGADDDDEDDDSDSYSRMTSATSTRSAPSIMQRPSSRGGSAFEIQWDDTGNAARPPRRL